MAKIRHIAYRAADLEGMVLDIGHWVGTEPIPGKKT